MMSMSIIFFHCLILVRWLHWFKYVCSPFLFKRVHLIRYTAFFVLEKWKSVLHNDIIRVRIKRIDILNKTIQEKNMYENIILCNNCPIAFHLCFFFSSYHDFSLINIIGPTTYPFGRKLAVEEITLNTVGQFVSLLQCDKTERICRQPSDVFIGKAVVV